MTEINAESPERDEEKWDLRFLGLAEYVSQWSKDPSTKVGAVIVDENNRVVSLGYNGLAQGIKDSDERLNNRELKYSLIIHGEENAMIFAERSLKGCTLYTHPFLPCPKCANKIIQHGFKRVVAPMVEKEKEERWKEPLEMTKELFSEAGINWTVYNMELLK